MNAEGFYNSPVDAMRNCVADSIIIELHFNAKQV